ncbi:C39 family peptidase [uncultured Ruthenibacterium sp.]|uniref:C39 family peptidase n=1 Tax=uncultured Ruthenibacterium sp. TaxID=1905347 RepID=UPI00349ED241
MTTVLQSPEMPCTSHSQISKSSEHTKNKAKIKHFRWILLLALLTVSLTFGANRFLTVKGYILDPLRVEPVMQLPELPNGCEASSLATVLQYYGYSVDKLDLAYGYIPRADFWEQDGVRYGINPENAYPGDPATGRGFYCFAEPLVEGANQYLSEQGSSYYAYDITGVTEAGLRQYLSEEIPVIVWITIDGEQPREGSFEWVDERSGETIRALANVHCVVLTALGESKCVLSDPLNGERLMDKEDFLTSFLALGSRAVVIHD